MKPKAWRCLLVGAAASIAPLTALVSAVEPPTSETTAFNTYANLVDSPLPQQEDHFLDSDADEDLLHYDAEDEERKHIESLVEQGYLTYNDDKVQVPEKVLELDVQVRQTGNVNHALALFTDDNPSADNGIENGQGFLEKNLSDFFDIQIFSTVYFGSRKEPHQLIFDTGSSWLWVQTPYCDSCTSHTSFIHRYSSTFKVDQDFDIFQINYGSGSVLAFEASDEVCLDKASQICSETVFANVVMQHGLDGLQADGIIGLAPTVHTNQQNFTSVLFIDKLHEAGAIDDRVFSLMIDSDDSVDSKVTIGGYDSDKYGAEGTEMAWHSLMPSKEGKYNHWRLKMDQLKFGEYVIEDTNIESVIVDSGTSLVLLPEKEFKKFMQLIEYKANIPYSLANDFGLESFPCFKEPTYAQMPDLSFTLDGVQYTIPPASYIGYNAGVCTLKIMTNKRDKHFLTLGLNFFENYYTVFDVGQKRIGLQTSKHSKNDLDLDQSWQVSQLSSMLLESLGEAIADFADSIKRLLI